MKKLLLSFLLCFTFTFTQTSLSLGDIAFTGYDSDDDKISFVLLKEVTNGTTITFTDKGWDISPTGGFSATEGIITWTASGTLSYGTQVTLTDNSPWSASNGSVSEDFGGGPSLAAGGDQIFAYQGSAPTTANESNFLAALDFENAAGWDGYTDASDSDQPSVFTDGNTSFSPAHFDNGVYSDCTGDSDAATLRGIIYNSSNWSFSNTAAVLSFPPCSGAVLPVELTAFTALIRDNYVELNWNTATEVNNYGFEIERRETQDVRSEKWERIGFVPGHGNSNSPKDYSFIDENLTIGSIYYRLKQIDFDGSFEYSHTVEISLMKSLTAEFVLNQNFPNPFNPTTVISYRIPSVGTTHELSLQNVSLIVYDMLGNEITILVNEKQPTGSYSYNFNAFGLASGTYVYKLTTDNFVETKKMLLIK